jgi:hypothetical protein
MRYQRGGLILYAIGAVVVMALLAGAVMWVNHFIKVTWEDPAYARGAGEQLGKDSVVLEQVKTERDQLKTERDHAREDTAGCLSTMNVQSQKVNAWKSIADKSVVAAREAKVQAQKDATAQAPYIADLQAKAAAAPKLESCEARLAKADKALDDQLRIRRGMPAAGAK